MTNPGFVHERGDRYLIEVDADDLPHLYPCRSLIEAGIPVGGSTDAPFGHPDPWRDVAAAIERRTAGGEPLGLREAVSPERALALFLTPPEAPGGTPSAGSGGRARRPGGARRPAVCWSSRTRRRATWRPRSSARSCGE